MLRSIVAFMIAALLAVGSAVAADGPGQGNRGKGHAQGSRAGESGGLSVTVQIGEGERAAIHDYYGSAIASGRCPPGLAKKNNGCLPPGQAKKWALGRPLPRDVVFHDLPGDLAVRLSAPAGSRYVRVAADILLIAVGTGMVLDAIEDLGRL